MSLNIEISKILKIIFKHIYIYAAFFPAHKDRNISYRNIYSFSLKKKKHPKYKKILGPFVSEYDMMQAF